MSDPAADFESSTDRPTVLVVDDEEDLADLYEAWLEEEYDVRVAYDGKTALDSLDDAVSVVLLDRRMPDLSGDEVLETIRDRDMDCRVAMVTAVEPDVDIVDMGFDDYLQKPVDREDLIETVERLTRRSSYDRGVQQYFTAQKKRALLEDRLSPTEREQDDDYQRLVSRVEELESAVDDVVDDLEGEDFEILFRELD